MMAGMTLLPALSGRYPDRTDAVRVGDSTISWERLSAAAGALAGRLVGAPAVAVDAQPTLATVVSIVAGLFAGVPVVPVPADAGPLERGHVLRDSGATPLDPGEVDLTASGPGVLPEPAADAPALILYTSGTTGPPKGVVLSRDAIAADLDALAGAWAWTAEDTLVHGLPLYHVHGLVLGLLGALRTGSRLVHTVRPTPAGYAAAGGSLYFGVPTVWSRIAGDPAAARALSAARLLVSGSAALPVPVFESLRELTGHRPVERYGMTETLITIATRAAGDARGAGPDQRSTVGPAIPGAVGSPLPGIGARLVGEGGAPAPADGETIGELQVRGPTLFRGYLGQPAATEASFTPDGWFRTGDVATVDADGVYRIVGRSSTDLIKSGGYRIGAGEVENALLTHPAVREAAVIGVPHADLGEEIVAYVVAGAVSDRELIDFVADRLSVHKRPRTVHLVESLPRNALGKVQKKLLGH
jgi:fatty acid CoA ligase FadD36